MSGYSIQSLSPDPILVLTLTEAWDVSADLSGFVRDWRQALEAAGQPLITIVDVHSQGLPGLEDLAMAANEAPDGEPAVIHSSAMSRMVIVSSRAILSRCMHGQHPELFGHKRVTMCGSVEEALAEARLAA